MSDAAKNTSSNWTPPTVEELQAMLPQYEVSALWGQGGMGAVYKGRQKSLHRDVAIKVLPETFATGASEDDPHQFVERFKLEARAMANLDHPAILSVYDFGQTEKGHLYIVMEFVDGMDIYAYLQHHGGRLPDKHAIAITAHVLDALQYAHDHSVVHRDIKPANVLINSEGRVKLADFGLAKRIAELGEDGPGAPMTLPNTAMGTPDFVAPEALELDRKPDGRADLYAVGVMLYQLLTGKMPRGQFEMPSKLLPELDPRFDDIVSRALQPNPDSRYATATAFRSDLDKILSHPIPKAADPQSSAIPMAKLAENAAPASKAPAAAEPEKSKAPLWIGVGLAAVLAIGGVVAFLVKGGDTGARTDVPTVREEPVASEPESAPKEKLIASAESADGPGSSSPPEDTETTLPEPAPAPTPKPLEPEKPEAPPEPEPAKPKPTPPDPGPKQLGASPASAPEPTKPKVTEPALTAPPPDPEAEALKEESSKLAAIGDLAPRLESYLTARRAAVGVLATKYLRALEGKLNQAADAGDLQLTKAYRTEKARVKDLQKALAELVTDVVATAREGATLPSLVADSPEGLVALREIWNGERQKIRADLDGKLQQSLKSLESELTKARDFERAEMILAFREQLAPKVVVAPPNSQPDKSPSTSPSKEPRARHDPEISRMAAQHALDKGANVRVQIGSSVIFVGPGKDLPKEDFELNGVQYPDFQNIPITDEDLKIYTQATELKVLDFHSGNEVKVTSLGPLANVRELTELSIFGYAKITQQDCETVASLKDLVHLEIAAPGFSVADFALMIGSAKLEDLVVSNSITDLANFAIIGRQTELKGLSLGNQVGDEHLQQLSGLSNLELLSTTGAPFTVAGLSALHPNLSKTLRTLGFGGTTGDSSNEFRLVAKNFPAMGSLHLRGEISGEAFSEIGALKKLHIVQFNQATFTPQHFAAISECRELIKMTIGRGTITAPDVDALKKLRNLKQLTLKDNGIQLDPEVFSALPALRHLTKLDLPKSKVAPEQLAALKKEMPDCEISLVEAYP